MPFFLNPDLRAKNFQVCSSNAAYYSLISTSTGLPHYYVHCSSIEFFARDFLRYAMPIAACCTYHYSVAAAVGVGLIYSVIQTFAGIEKRHYNCVVSTGRQLAMAPIRKRLTLQDKIKIIEDSAKPGFSRKKIVEQ